MAEQDHFTAQKLPAEKDLGWIKHHGAIIGIGSGMDLWTEKGTNKKDASEQCPSCLVQPACFGAGCYIEMVTSYHQPHEYELVGV